MPISLRLYLESHWRAFWRWCAERVLHPSSATVSNAADFRVFLLEVRCLAPQTIANYRTANASTFSSIDGIPLYIFIPVFQSSSKLSHPRILWNAYAFRSGTWHEFSSACAPQPSSLQAGNPRRTAGRQPRRRFFSWP